MKVNIKLYLIYHKEVFLPVIKGFLPIQVGAVQKEDVFEGALKDNTGENISAKNPSYCELTAQYWAWKNDVADYYGFFHYRRYLSFDTKDLVDYNNADKIKKIPVPYRIYEFPAEETLSLLGYRENITHIINRYDVIAPLAEQMYVSVYDQYKRTSFHYIEDLDLVLRIIRQKYPEYQKAAEEYMNSTRHYFGNIFIMKKELFHNYCAWLFDILAEFDQRTDFSKYNGKACRVDGYLGERLFGIYYTWLRNERDIRWAELPRAHFETFEGETNNFYLMKKINILLPPGTRRRAKVKKLLEFIKNN